MRIIAGKHRGRILLDTKHLKDLRPTTDFNRENLFNILNSSKNIKNTGFDLKNCHILDVFCGTGAIALEAISRGAKSAALIDNNNIHLETAKTNVQILKENNLEYFCFDLKRTIPKPIKKYNLIFIDPPYSKNLAAVAFNNLNNNGWIDSNALIVIEHSKIENLQSLTNKLNLLEQRKYKESIFSFFITTSSNKFL